MTERTQTASFKAELSARLLPGWQMESIYWTRNCTARFVAFVVVVFVVFIF